MREYPFTELQKQDIARAITFGIYPPPTALVGAMDVDTRNLKDIHTRLKKRAIFEEKDIGKDRQWRMVKRDLITTQGFSKYISELPSEDPLKLIENKYEKISVRNGLNAERFIRLCRQSDAQTFFHSIGVESPYTLIKYYGANPFIFGLPTITEDTGEETISGAVKTALIQYIQEKENTDFPLVMPDQRCPAALFVPNSYNPKSKPAKTETSHGLASANNAVGILIDFPNQMAYAVFKHFGRKVQAWKGKSYQAWLARCGKVMKQLGIKNIDNLSGSLTDAIFLCDTYGEIYEIAKQSEKMRSPFRKVIPIIVNKEGAETIGTILYAGLQEYENQMAAGIKRCISEADLIVPTTSGAGEPAPARLRYNGRTLVNGVLINYRWLGDLKNHLTQPSPLIPYIACSEETKPIYLEIGVPEDHLFVIDCEAI